MTIRLNRRARIASALTMCLAPLSPVSLPSRQISSGLWIGAACGPIPFAGKSSHESDSDRSIEIAAQVIGGQANDYRRTGQRDIPPHHPRLFPYVRNRRLLQRKVLLPTSSFSAHPAFLVSLFRRLPSWRRHFARVDLTASRLATLVGDPVTLRSVARRLHLQFGPDRSGMLRS